MNLKDESAQLVQSLKLYKRILIYIKGSPDPDVIASSYVLKLICEAYDISATIYSPQRPSLPQNSKLVEDLDLPIRFENGNQSVKGYDAYAVLDHPNVSIEGITGVIPCAVHIDHHQEEVDELPVDFKLIREDAGSTSTIMIFLMSNLKQEIPLDDKANMRVATSLAYGILTDTDNMSLTQESDRLALSIIGPDSDKNLLSDLSSLPFPRETMSYLHLALQQQVIYKKWLIAGIGYMDESHRDSIALMADFLLKRRGIDTVVIFALIEKEEGLSLASSIRTDKKGFDLNQFIKNITPDGGGRTFKGAYTINLDYFSHCLDRNLLWKVTYQTTLEALKKNIDLNNHSD